MAGNTNSSNVFNKKDNCIGCPYAKENTKVVDGIRMDKEILLVMQSPGESENTSGIPLSGTKGSSATKILQELLPPGKKLDDYAVTELVKCTPGKQQPNKIALAICCRYLEKEISNGNYKKVVCFCVDASPIVENIRHRLSKTFDIVTCVYPRNTMEQEEKLAITKALNF